MDVSLHFFLKSVVDRGGYWASHAGHFSPWRWALGTLSIPTLINCHWLGTLPTRGVQVAETRQSGREPGAPLCCIYFALLGSISFNQVAMCRVEGTCGQRPCCVRRYMLCFVTFHLTHPLLLGGVWGGGSEIFFYRPPNPLPSSLIRKVAYYTVSCMFTGDCVSWWKIWSLYAKEFVQSVAKIYVVIKA